MALLDLTHLDLYKYYKPFSKPVDSRNSSIKYLTNEELRKMQRAALDNVLKTIQLPPHPMPPVIRTRKILSEDPLLAGLDHHSLAFIDISENIPEHCRDAVIRDPDGTLRTADSEEFTRLTKTVVPVAYRTTNTHPMFAYAQNLESLLSRGEYVHLLKTAFNTFLINEADLTHYVELIYKHVKDNSKFDRLLSTEYYPGFVYYLVTKGSPEALFVHLLQSKNFADIVRIFKLRSLISETVELDSGDDTDNRIVSQFAMGLSNIPETDEEELVEPKMKRFYQMSLQSEDESLLKNETSFQTDKILQFLELFVAERETQIPGYIQEVDACISTLKAQQESIENSDESPELSGGESKSELAIELESRQTSVESGTLLKSINALEATIGQSVAELRDVRKLQKVLQLVRDELSEHPETISVNKPDFVMPDIRPTVPVSLSLSVPVLPAKHIPESTGEDRRSNVRATTS
jgi:hypothetical protein